MPGLVGGFGNFFTPTLIGAADLKKYFRFYSIINSSSNLSAYLTGLWEGDGHIWIPKTTHAPSGKKYVPHWAITFDKKEYPLIILLKTILGGTVREKKR